ncbi:hypothetical protein [Rufibacter quisquiliarum]|uniref:Uncharacterized protein n=1 Tax=Rufibacter quisquiliarum TaxID=1549639 RepID=A0A839GD40_9BACT|nr:hypothetical protein [Rufibacter quisquiliarum]MBA9075443.1 hypothetical protein [Rufibacter quisquiliarum]
MKVKSALMLFLALILITALILFRIPDKKSTIKLIIDNPELNIKSALRIYLIENLSILKATPLPWDKWGTVEYTLLKSEPVHGNCFYVPNIKHGTYLLTVAVDVKNESFPYGGMVEKVVVEKDTVEVKIELDPIRRSFSDAYNK